MTTASVIHQHQLSSKSRLRISIKSAKSDIAQLKRQIRGTCNVGAAHSGEYRDFLYVLLDEACERLNSLQRKANRMGVAV